VANQFATGKRAIAQCDRCGFRYKLKQLKTLTIKTKNVNILVCPSCWEPDHPQLQLGMYPVNDPQALRNPRRDTTYQVSGTLANGNLGEGSRIIQWGWAPVGGSTNPDQLLTPNYIRLTLHLGSVTVVVT
jgi:hypothetical protein